MTPPSTLDGRTFVSTEVTGQTLVPDTELTISFEDGRLAAVAGCNTMIGGYELDGDELVVDQLAQTLMACMGDLGEQDVWVAALLSGRPTVTLAGESLTLASDEVTVVLQDQPAEAEAGAEQPLAGAVWAIESITTASGSVGRAGGRVHHLRRWQGVRLDRVQPGQRRGHGGRRRPDLRPDGDDEDGVRAGDHGRRGTDRRGARPAADVRGRRGGRRDVVERRIVAGPAPNAVTGQLTRFDEPSQSKRGANMSATASSDGAIRLMPPSIETSLAVDVDASSTIPPTATIVGVFVAPTGDVDGRLGVDRSQLDGHGFTGTVGNTLLVTSTDGTPGAAIGLGDPGSVTASSLRDAAASFARAAGKRVDLAIVAPTTTRGRSRRRRASPGRGRLTGPLQLRCAPHRATRHTGARRDRGRRRRRRRRCSHRRPAGPGVRRGHQVVAATWPTHPTAT